MNLPRILIGVCAYNEEKNLGRLLHNLISKQSLPKNSRILVVCSGCTDSTPQIVDRFRRQDGRIESLVEGERKGKANALNKIFEESRKSAEVLILVNADALPELGSVTKLVNELVKNGAGAVFAQPVPLVRSNGLCSGIVRTIWRLHHVISVRREPKLSGELCAISSSCLQSIPENVATDEPYIELAIRKRGLDIIYVPQAVVYIRCPATIIDLVKQRKRIWIGHMQLRNESGFVVSTSSFGNIIEAVPKLNLKEILYLSFAAVLEAFAYVQAKTEANRGKIPYAWEPIKSTKT